MVIVSFLGAAQDATKRHPPNTAFKTLFILYFYLFFLIILFQIISHSFKINFKRHRSFFRFCRSIIHPFGHPQPQSLVFAQTVHTQSPIVKDHIPHRTRFQFYITQVDISFPVAQFLRIVHPGIDGYKEGAWEFCAYDVDKANEYLDKVAPAGANGDRGISVTLSYNQDGGHKEIMESIIGDLAKVGVTAVSDTPEWSALLEQYQNFNYQFGRLGWIADYPIMDNFLYPLFHSDSLGGDNRSGYNNPEFDAKVDEARTTVDDKERVAKMQEADAMVAADCPVIPVMFYTHTIAGSDRIKHLYVDPQKHADLGTAELA